MSEILKTVAVTKSFGNNIVLNGAEININAGERVGLIGDSGAGKSTLAKIICGMERPDGGEIIFKGMSLWGKRYDRKTGERIQLVYQQPFAVLDPAQRIISGFEELIKYRKKAKKSDAERMIYDVCERVDIDVGILGHRPHRISGGEAQRIAVAKALLLEPELLIMDEATSMLDVSTQANVLASVGREMKRADGAILLISHDKDLVEFYCDRVYKLENKILTEKR